MSEPCALCGGPVNPFDPQTWEEVLGWVGGPKKDGMTLRHKSGRYAHDHCVRAMRDGQDPASQPTLDEEPWVTQPAAAPVPSDTDPTVVEDLFADDDTH